MSPLYVHTPSNTSSEERTVLVLGLARGGTSLISGILRELGVFMGDQAHPLKHEFDLFQESDDPATIQRIASALNAQHKVWGWKSPRTVFFADKILYHLRNPHIIVALRNPISVAQSSENYNHLPFRIGFTEAAEVIHEISRLLSRCPYPVSFLNFELALKDPHGVVDAVKTFLKMPDPNGERTRNAVEFIHAGGGYRPIQADMERRLSLLEELEVDNKIDTLGVLSHLIPTRISELNNMADHLEQDIVAAQAIVNHLALQVPKELAAETAGTASKETTLKALDLDEGGSENLASRSGDKIFSLSLAEKKRLVAGRWHEVSDLKDAYQAAWNRFQLSALYRAELQRQIELLASLK